MKRFVNRNGAAVAALLCAVAADAAPAASVYSRLFPYAFADLATAQRSCESLMEPSSIVLASKGAVVFMTSGGRRQIIPHSGVATFATAIRDPRDADYPVDSVVERRGGSMVSILAKRRSPSYLGAVRCWFSGSDGSLRLLSMDVDIPRT